MKKIIIVDVMALAFRSFYALQRANLRGPDGQPTGVMYGCLQTLWRLIESEKPDYFVLACDHRSPTFRKEIYPDYKANRGEMEPELSEQLPELFNMFKAWNIPCITCPGFEADDIIGTITNQWGHEKLECIIFSGDKDFQQLLNQRVSLLKQDRKGEFAHVTETTFREKYDLNPNQFIDILALWGDASDNIPGAKGVGEKTATKYIQKYGSVEELYKNIDDIKGKAHLNLKQSNDNVELSKRLVAIKVDMDLELNLEHCECDPTELLTHQGILDWTIKCGFNSLQRRIKEYTKSLQESSKVKEPAAIADQTDEDLKSSADFAWETISSFDQLQRLTDNLRHIQSFSFDSETTGLDIVTDTPIGLSFCYEPNKAYYLPLEPKHLKDIHPDQLKKCVRVIFQTPGVLKIAHNLKYDLHMLNNWQITPTGPFYDTMLAAHCDPKYEGRFGLDPVTENCLGWKKIPTTALMGKDKSISMKNVPLKIISLYASEDALATYRLYQYFEQELDVESNRLVRDVESPLAKILMQMERQGIQIDFEALEKISDVLAKDIEVLSTRIQDIAGEEFNISSPKQLAPIIYEKLQIPEKLGIKKIKKTKSGLSTDKETLESMSSEPIIEDILQFRQLSKLKNTYVDPLPQMLHPETNRIHTHYHQTGTATGRLSSSDPNLQNIPIRSERGQQVRQAFRAANGWKLISADYSQIELRLLAHISSDQGLLEAFKQGTDIHSATAAKMFHLPITEVNREYRSRAKAINYGLAYGMGAQRLAKTTGASLTEAKQFIESYFNAFPGIANYMDSSVNLAETNGFARTILGRKRPLKTLGEKSKSGAMARNMAINTPIQGSSADLMKVAMLEIADQLESSDYQAKLLLQVHDELVLEVLEEDVPAVTKLVKTIMENTLSSILKVPLEVDTGVGQNWLEAH